MDCFQMNLDGVVVAVLRKRVKNINICVYPPDGRVRVSAPVHCSEETIHKALISRLNWIHRKREALRGRTCAEPIALVEGAEVSCFGKAYTLSLIDHSGRADVDLNGDVLLLRLPSPQTVEKIQLAIDDWYRHQLQCRVPELIDRWQKPIGVEVREWRIRKMKTRWGSCNIREHRIWLNLALAKLSPEFLEYVVIHEMVHLLERYHNARFYQLLDRFYPHWREIRQALKRVNV